MNLKEHADKLAGQVVALLKVTPSYHDAHVKTAETVLQEYRSDCAVEWVKAPDVCEALHISRRTLVRWRQENRIEAGKHWRRMGSGSHCLYDLRALEQQMNEWAK